jgi:hypothetical protein
MRPARALVGVPSDRRIVRILSRIECKCILTRRVCIFDEYDRARCAKCFCPRAAFELIHEGRLAFLGIQPIAPYPNVVSF